MKKSLLTYVLLSFSMPLLAQEVDLVLQEKDGKYGFFDDKSQKMLINYRYEEAEDLGTANLWQVQYNGKYGIVDAKKGEVWSCQFDEPIVFTDQCYDKGMYAIVEKSGKYGIIDAKGQFLFPCQYDEDILLQEDCSAVVTRTGKTGLISIKTMKELIPCKYENKAFLYGDPSDKYCFVTYSKLKGMIDTAGVELIPCKYKTIEMDPKFSYFFWVRVGSKGALYSLKEKKQITSAKYTNKVYGYGDISEKHAIVNVGKYQGLIDTLGKEIIPCKYIGINKYSEPGRFLVEKKTGFGVFDPAKKKEVMPCLFDEVIDQENAFKPNFKIVVLKKKYGLFDVDTHKQVAPCEYMSQEQLIEEMKKKNPGYFKQ